MKRLFCLLLLILNYCFYCHAADPVITPAFFKPTDQITVVYDVTGTVLSSFSEAYLWVWIPNTSLNAKYNINPANSNTAITNVAGPNGPKLTKSTVNDRTYFTITFIPATFFNSSIDSQKQLGMLLKGNDWPQGQSADYIADFWDGTFQFRVSSPLNQPAFVDTNEVLNIQAVSSSSSTMELSINDVVISTQTDVLSFSYQHTVSEASGFATVKLKATVGEITKSISFQYIIRGQSSVQSRPAGIIPGINYRNDPTKVTLCLWAPGKKSVYVNGDFCDWTIQADYQMKKDNEYFWIELSGLTVGKEYAFQYIVDETIRVADPYTDKILDPDDKFIPATSYPDLKTFPAKAVSSKWYENRLAVFQTNQSAYSWKATSFVKPEKKELVIYELLLRDFFDDQHRNFQTLIDTIGYFKRLGINAIELMPVMEFNGNEGWGYNPTFLFAVDKYYGTKNKMKEFVDVCHQNNIAVILDIAMNHHDIPNPYVSMYFDYATSKPTAVNPWFNTTARHPFNVFFDMNHESSYTKKYLDTVAYHWLNEYKVDGFRFDLSKGFTQQNNPNDVDKWSTYDPSRIALLKRMADKIWSHTPDAYIVLEHFAANNEEKELAEYKATEGKGMMLWGKMTDPYTQNTMGYASNSDVSGIYHAQRGWTSSGLVGYMESHDEERVMYKNLLFGRSEGVYSVKDKKTALSRMPAAFSMFLTVPGPKMLWQFGEVGYDQSINRCVNGTTSTNCRLSPKPPLWEYTADDDHAYLFSTIADLLRLRNNYKVFTKGDASFSGSSSLVKSLTLRNQPYTASPADSSQMNVQVVANFDLSMQTAMVDFPHLGNWYDYANGGGLINVTFLPFPVSLNAGHYSLFTDVPLKMNVVTSVNEQIRVGEGLEVYPNPGSGWMQINCKGEILEMNITEVTGRKAVWETKNKRHFLITSQPGLYVLSVRTKENIWMKKVLIQ